MTSALTALRAAIERHGKKPLADALTALEQNPLGDQSLALLQECFDNPHKNSHVIGVTGPPGVGKSTLLNGLIVTLRERHKKIAVIAVDPSSHQSGGALLGDRTRLNQHASDAHVFIRSQAAGDQLGGLARSTLATMLVMRSLYDEVIIETVGVGQSEIDVLHISDTIVLCLQPASGDALQSMKAGIMEIADIFVVTKSDLGHIARQTAADIKTTLRHESASWQRPLVMTSAFNGTGLDALYDAICQHREQCHERIAQKRQTHSERFFQSWQHIKNTQTKATARSFSDAKNLR